MNKKIIATLLLVILLILGIYLIAKKPRYPLLKNTSTQEFNTLKEVGRSDEGPSKIYYAGKVTLSGKYKYFNSPNSMGEENFTFYPDEKSIKVLPSGQVEIPNFTLPADKASSMFNFPSHTCRAEGMGEIEIDSYHLLTAELGGQSSSNLLKVSSSTNFSYEVDTAAPYDCEEF